MKKKPTFLGLTLCLLIWASNLLAQNYIEIPGGDAPFEDTLFVGNSNYFWIHGGADVAADIFVIGTEINFYTISGQDTTLIPFVKGVFVENCCSPTLLAGIRIIIQVPVDIPPNTDLLSDVMIEVHHDRSPFADAFYYRPNVTFHLIEDDNILWGKETNEGDFNGGINGWTTNAVSDPDAEWVWEADGKADLGAYSDGTGDLAIQSPSFTNGAMVFDSDYYDNDGNQNNPGGGIAPAPQLSELISPLIDLSGVTTGVAVEFNQYMRQFSSVFALSYSMNGGASWSDLLFLNEDTPANEQTERFDVQTIPLPGATGCTQFQIKFIINGNYYFWIIDDVKLLEHDFVPSDDVIWGAEPEQGDFKNGLNDWTTLGINDPDAVWVWEADGKADLGAYSTGSGNLGIFSASVFDGAMVFDSDFYDNGGNQNNPGGGIAPAPHVGELISPVIDLSGNPYLLTLKFHQYFRQFSSTTSVAFSMDGGNTWSSPIEINTAVPQNEGTSRSDIQYVPLIGAFATNEFRVKFIMNGNYYFWIVDDVKILIDSSISLLPAIPNLVSPTNGATNELINTNLSWNSSANANSYSIQVDTEIDFSQPLVFEDTVTNNSTSTPQLDYNTTYYWRVNAANLAGESDWSEVWNFTTEMMTGLEELKTEYGLKVYPNPSDGQFTLETKCLVREWQVSVFNLQGQRVWEDDWEIKGNDKLVLQLGFLAKGMYWLQITDGTERVWKKIVVQ
jgi:type IX secretion system substrate protein